MRLGCVGEKEGMLRAPGDLRPLKIRPARPSASSQLRQVYQSPGTHSSKIPRQLRNYPGNRTGGGPDVVARAAAEGRGRPPGEGRRGPCGRSAGTIETWPGRARLREREAVQGHGQRYFRPPHFRLRSPRCWCRRPGWETAGLCPRRLVSVRL